MAIVLAVSGVELHRVVGEFVAVYLVVVDAVANDLYSIVVI